MADRSRREYEYRRKTGHRRRPEQGQYAEERSGAGRRRPSGGSEASRRRGTSGAAARTRTSGASGAAARARTSGASGDAVRGRASAGSRGDEYNWKFSGDDINTYRAKYTQGFDPDYLKRPAIDEQAAEEAERQRRAEAAAARRRASRRGRRLRGQQTISERTYADEIREREQAKAAAQAPKDSGRKRKKTAAYRRRLLITRGIVLGLALFGIIMLVLVLSNRHELSLTMAGADPLVLELGSDYHDPGATAFYTGTIFHNKDREVAVTAVNDVNTEKCGTYEIHYKASFNDAEAEAVRTVIVPDRIAPEITLDASVNVVKQGAHWKDSYTASDDQDGDITSRVQVTGEVNMDVVGRYELTYDVEDTGGNRTTITRWVTVSDVPLNNPEKASHGDDNVIYLTFDDGPGEYTEELLDILDRHNVRATFFVTDANPDFRDLIREESHRGHSVGVHSKTHDYKTIYKDAASFWEDYEQELAIVKDEIGFEPKFMRFPGGSSNDAGDGDYTLMYELFEDLEEKNIRYYDWNIDSGDSYENWNENDVYWNLIGTIPYIETFKMILCHDLKEASVYAMEDFLSWAIDEGYVFLPITADTPDVHHIELWKEEEETETGDGTEEGQDIIDLTQGAA